MAVKLFAGIAQRAGKREIVLELQPGATVADAQAALALDLHGKIAWAVNQAYAHADQPLRDGDVLAAIPAVSGG